MAAELSGLSIQQTIRRGPVWDELHAEQAPLGRKVRLFRLARGLLPTSPLANHLRRAAKVLSELDHEGIVRLLDFRETDSTLVLVLEDAIDQTLADLWESPFSSDACICLGMELSRAMSHAHGRGVVHGRLAPEVVRFDARGRVKLEGFGMLLPVGDVEPVETEVQAGLAPETTIGQNASPMSDLFCLGAILYQALSGEAPFGDPRESGYAARVRNDTPTPLIKTCPESPLALRQIIEQCLDKRASNRPSDAAQVRATLEALRKAGTEDALQRELARRGAVTIQEGGGVPAAQAAPPRKYRPGRLEAVVLGCLMGGFVTYGATRFRSDQKAAPSPLLSLSTVQRSEKMLLRVVATPWAHVLVDGDHRETTPFAQPIQLSPGRHVIRLEHPNAPPEERVVEGQAGQSILLDVRMAVKTPVPAASDVPEVPEDGTP